MSRMEFSLRNAASGGSAAHRGAARFPPNECINDQPTTRGRVLRRRSPRPLTGCSINTRFHAGIGQTRRRLECVM